MEIFMAYLQELITPFNCSSLYNRMNWFIETLQSYSINQVNMNSIGDNEATRICGEMYQGNLQCSIGHPKELQATQMIGFVK